MATDVYNELRVEMVRKSIYGPAAAWRKVCGFWSDLPLRVKGLAAIAIALCAASGGTLLEWSGSILAILLFTSDSMRGERDQFFKVSPDMLCITTLEGEFRRVNPVFAATLGHTEAELRGRCVLDFAHDDEREATRDQWEGLARGNSIADFENRLRCADGAYKWVVWSAASVAAEGLVFAAARDITRHKLAEQALRQSTARLSWVLESTTDAFFALDKAWHFTYVNPEAERLLQRKGEALVGRNILETLPSAEKFYHRYEEAERSGKAVHFEEFYEPFQQWLEVHAHPSEEGLSVYFRDITERHRAEAGMLRALKEKEVLLREIHHRVKNNLQVVCSMLRLQAGLIKDETLSEVLSDCRARVLAMALLHDQLHRAKDLSSIDMAEYIRNLTASLFCSYGVNSKRIALRLDADSVPVSIDIAVPCGLIIHELVSNAVRHAFPEDAPGQISVSFHVDAEGQVRLEVSDDGIGFSERAYLANTRSLGLRLVTLLAEQLEATVERSGDHGTQHRFTFRPKKSKEEKESNEQASHPAGRG